jgi:hypothetical protein
MPDDMIVHAKIQLYDSLGINPFSTVLLNDGKLIDRSTFKQCHIVDGDIIRFESFYGISDYYQTHRFPARGMHETPLSSHEIDDLLSFYLGSTRWKSTGGRGGQ